MREDALCLWTIQTLVEVVVVWKWEDLDESKVAVGRSFKKLGLWMAQLVCCWSES